MEYDLSMLKKLAGEDDRFILDILHTFRRNTPPAIRLMVDLEAQNKYEALGREAHKLIPGVSFLGATSLKDILVSIEEGVKKKENLDRMHAYVAEASRMAEELIRQFDRDFNLDKDAR